jgi:hypothetical protein
VHFRLLTKRQFQSKFSLSFLIFQSADRDNAPSDPDVCRYDWFWPDENISPFVAVSELTKQA